MRCTLLTWQDSTSPSHFLQPSVAHFLQRPSTAPHPGKHSVQAPSAPLHATHCSASQGMQLLLSELGYSWRG